MQPRKCSLDLYANFLISNQNRYSGAELERVSPVPDLHHDAVSRWLMNTTFAPSDLWYQVKNLVQKDRGYLIADDSLLDKRYSRHNELARIQYSGNEHGLVNGICIVNMLWTEVDEVRTYAVARKSRVLSRQIRAFCSYQLIPSLRRHISSLIKAVKAAKM